MSLAEKMREMASNRLPHLADEKYVIIIGNIKLVAYQGLFSTTSLISEVGIVEKLKAEGFKLTPHHNGVENYYLIEWSKND